MRRLILFAALALAACSPTAPPGSIPNAAAESTVLDEQVALGVEAAYAAARVGVELAVDAGKIKGAEAAKVAALNAQAYAAVRLVRAAYETGNAASYPAAAANALGLVNQLTAMLGGSSVG